MKILSTRPLTLPDVKVVRFARFRDERGWFSEPFRKSDLAGLLPAGEEIVQANESYSRPGVMRGLHFQWNPFMGKLVRTLSGRMVDVALDIRPGSPTLGKAILHEMPALDEGEEGEWIWVPPGFAHGNFFTAATHIEYLCTGEYSPGCEAGISPFAADIDWSLCDAARRDEFLAFLENNPVISAKDRGGLSLSAWLADPRAAQFAYGRR